MVPNKDVWKKADQLCLQLQVVEPQSLTPPLLLHCIPKLDTVLYRLMVYVSADLQLQRTMRSPGRL